MQINHVPAAGHPELNALRELTARVGSDPLLTQASTGNSSLKLDGALWIKASGKWMANALCDEILIPVNCQQVIEHLRQGWDPAESFPNASLETAMHAVLPHRVVLHVHSVNAIAWAVRNDARSHLQERLHGFNWHWVPYVPSGRPLALEMERVRSANSGANIYILGNHGLVLGGDDVEQVRSLLANVEERLKIRPRCAPSPDYQILEQLCDGSNWALPEDREIHALGTDADSQAILANGSLYPCQAMFSGPGVGNLFSAISSTDLREFRQTQRSFLIIDGVGGVIKNGSKPTEIAMLAGLSRVVQRLQTLTSIRYLTEWDMAALSGQVAYRYRELADAGQHG